MERVRDSSTDVAAAMAENLGDQGETVHHEKRHKRDMRPASMTLNLTSMIDVVFQLLIYFILTIAFVMGEGIITANLPTGSGVAAESDPLAQKIEIVLSSAGTQGIGYRIRLEGMAEAPTNFTSLAEMLTRFRHDPATNPGGIYDPKETPVIIRPEGDVRWQHVVNAFNAAVTAKFQNVAFASKQE